MALLAGSVAVDGAGVATGTGLALARFTAQRALFETAMVGVPLEPEKLVGMLQQLASAATSSAAADIAYLTGNAEVSVTVSAGGLQKTTTVGVATAAPAAPVTIPGTFS